MSFVRFLLGALVAVGLTFTMGGVANAATAAPATIHIADRDHRCTPEHRGDNWRWHDGHWDHRDNRHDKWEHRRWDDNYCDRDHGRDHHDQDNHHDRDHHDRDNHHDRDYHGHRHNR